MLRDNDIARSMIGLALLPDKYMDDDYLRQLWYALSDQNLLDITFYDGSCRSVPEFISFARDPLNTFFAIDNGEEIFGVVWLNQWDGYTARLHFCGFRNSWGKLSRYLGWFVHINLFNAKRQDGTEYLITATGSTPATNRLALRFIRQLGYRQIGIIPNGCYRPKDGDHVDAVISYCNRQTLEERYGRSIGKT